MVVLGDLGILLNKHMFEQVKVPQADGTVHWINSDRDRYSALLNCPDYIDYKEINMVQPMVDLWVDTQKNEISLDRPLGKNISRQYNTWAKYYIKKKRTPKIKVKGMSFYSIVPKDRLPFDEAEAEKIRGFCEYFFEKKFRKFIEKCWWVVESGKFKESPNLHIHALLSFKPNGAKNFRRELVTSWNKFWSDSKYTIDWKNPKGCGIHRVPCNTAQIQEDKVKYMENDHKGSHENFTDLGISGKF